MYMGPSSSTEAEWRSSDEPTLHFRSRFLIIQNVICALLSVAVLATAFWIASRPSSNGGHCAAFMHRPIIAVGSLLLLISLIGLFAAIANKAIAKKGAGTYFLEWLHLILVFCLVILLFCFAIFSLEITNQGLAHHVIGYGQSYREYRLFEYPKWMQHRIKNSKYWSGVRACLQRSHVCTSVFSPEFSSNLTYVSIADLTPIQGGCCIPPSACNISFLGSQKEVQYSIQKAKNDDINKPVYGSSDTRKQIRKREDIKEKLLSTSIHAYTRDCNKWSSIPSDLCFNCDTCKAGVIQTNMNTWKNAAILYVVLVMTMVLICALFACYGFVDRKSQENY
ncbi:hypothetical protein L7F22_048840 [Adiantum nelumboides]|nr:hypothetical protein [Adiantum nelumboides]